MKALGMSLLLAAGLLTAGATQIAAQRTGGGVFGRIARPQVILEEAARRDREAARQESARQRQRTYDPRYETGRARRGNGGGPPFCRNGQGHPTKGWQWCVDKGWASAAPYARTTRPAARGRWSDVILGRPQTQQQPRARGGRKSL
jgi:hypothetical protein